MFLTNGTKLEYPLHTDTPTSQYIAFKKFSEYLKNDMQNDYHDYEKNDSVMWGSGVVVLFLGLLIFSIFALKKELKEHNFDKNYQ